MSDRLPSVSQQIAANLSQIRDRMQAAYDQSGRSDAHPKLIAVTKYAQPEWLDALYELGERDFGESRPQQLRQRADQFATQQHRTGIRWHQIGQLQRNKARQILPVCTLIHSVDSIRLFQYLERLAVELNLRPRILLQLNISGEDSKSGFSPTQLLADSDHLNEATHLQVSGLMTMAPNTAETSVIRSVFAGLREFAEQLRPKLAAADQLTELSMGMSGDFEAAILEGATLVRVGSGLYAGCDR